MAKFSYKTGGKEVWEATQMIVPAGAAMVMSNQVLDLRKIFSEMNTKNPDRWWLNNQGLIKVGAGLTPIFLYSAITNKKMPIWLKAIFIGIALQGGFQQARKWTTGDDGSSPIQQMGNGNGANLRDLDELMRKAAGMSGEPGQYDNTTGIGGNYNNAVDLDQYASSGIGFDFDLLKQNGIYS